VHIVFRFARLIERSFTDDTKQMYDRVVIDDAAGTSAVEAGRIRHSSRARGHRAGSAMVR
jgi:hypothetical protein